MSYERTTKDSVEYIANKFAENPGHFVATILRMYWDMEKQRDQYKADNEKLERENGELRKTLIKTQNLADELMEYQVKYINLTNHIRLKAEINPSVDRYIELNKFVDRLERD